MCLFFFVCLFVLFFFLWGGGGGVVFVFLQILLVLDRVLAINVIGYGFVAFPSYMTRETIFVSLCFLFSAQKFPSEQRTI